MMSSDGKLAISGGRKEVTTTDEEIFHWPIITEEDEAATLEVLRAGSMSGTDITAKFEAEFADWMGVKYAVAYHNGTASLAGAMFGAGLGKGDEIICPSCTFWASIAQALSLRAVPVFCDVEPDTLCMDPDDMEQHISEYTRAIMVVHQFAHPADMDRITAIAEKYGLKVIEDVSHAQGGKYKGRMLGTFGAAAGMSLMSGKSFAIGEGGMMVTDDRSVFERAVAFGFYERTFPGLGIITDPELQRSKFVPLGGLKHRMPQTASAVGRVQMKYYEERCSEILRARDYFEKLLEDIPGLKPHRVDESEGSTMAGGYWPIMFYDPDAFGGLTVERFAEAVAAEGARCSARPRNYVPLHLHPLFNDIDVYGEGEPTIIANAARDTRQPQGSLPVTESIFDRIVGIPWFKRFRVDVIEQHAAAFRKVAENYAELLGNDS